LPLAPEQVTVEARAVAELLQLERLLGGRLDHVDAAQRLVQAGVHRTELGAQPIGDRLERAQVAAQGGDESDGEQERRQQEPPVAPRMRRAIQPSGARAAAPPRRTVLNAAPVRVGMAALSTLDRSAPRMKLARKCL